MGAECSLPDSLSPPPRGTWRLLQHPLPTWAQPLMYSLRGKNGVKYHEYLSAHPQGPRVWGPSAWEWLPDRDRAECSLPRMNRSAMCTVLARLRLRRIFMVGDSLEYARAQSLWKLVGGWPEPRQHGPTDGKVLGPYKLDCNASNLGPDVTFQFVFNARLRNNTHTEQNLTKQNLHDPQSDACYICIPWVEAFRASHAPTLLLTSLAGSHHHSVSDYEGSLGRFFDTLLASVRASDVVVLRSNSNGQSNCTTYKRPFHDTSEFVLSREGPYNWDLFPVYDALNQLYVRRNLNRVAAQGATLRYLDVWPMSVLRPDARMGLHDCLHFAIPGLPDWWNHLQLAQLESLASARPRDTTADAPASTN